MQNYKMCIAYDGRKYKGFNTIKGDTEKSIQGKLEAILLKLYEREVEVVGAVNTDAGVHATGQVVNFKAVDERLSDSEILTYFEKYLTDDIIVLSIEAVDERFHSRYLSKKVTYEYHLWKKDAPNRPLFERYYVNLMNQLLDVSKIEKASKAFLGTHDFSAFTTNKKVKHPLKEVFELDVEDTAHEIIITITANGFLLNMERLMVGTLVQVGLGQLPINAVEQALKSQDTKFVGHKASSDALTLVDVEY
ncbi:tRNA pseudouridine(38-40) synthase TruA [Fusibacter ferrireducens]|uniref:tRNA pseudouridine synthase A n=1 Tax=Fusibacter ferrireducens TaxID=2785058 RepID=A0ABR9ZSE3_9FIRM|nr:tRNA pseudouridine(38-40) synthase TruA [Fusibacter ferrireducens]MBF4693383.1 tRNA pseudouridine(38-40) synthase TruA [Fusibacter ferrireducens]